MRNVQVLILSADIGEGHDAPARALRDGIAALRPDVEVTIADSVAASGPVVRALVRNGAEFVLGRLPWLFDLQYLLVARWAPSRAVAMRLASLLGRRRLLRAVHESGADVVVCTYPPANQVLAVERLRGTLRVPLVSAITDLAALRYWAHPGCDLHLVIHAESADEVRAIAGAGARIAHVRGLSAAGFDRPLDAAVARAALGLPDGAPVVTVSGGGWGIGDLRSAVRAAADAAGDVQVVVLCGHNAGLRRRLDAQFGAGGRVRTLGFTDRMPELLAATDVLVHSTAGLTVQEALVRGARVISYGWGVGHIRINNDAYRRFGLAEVVTDARALTGAIRRALASPRAPDLAYGRLPTAADAVLALAGR
jgi:UDP-N-acetylglucosamine:LPS N-acetylglucosamine transferase